jgi:hypothetical protein
VKRAAVVGVAVAAAVVVGCFAWWLVARPPSAEDAARSYLEALSAGDFATIDEMRAVHLDDETERIIADAFAGADAFVKDPRIEEISSQGGTVGVRASAEIAGERRDLFFELGDERGRWTLSGDYLATLEVTTSLAGSNGLAGDSAWVGGALAPAGAPVSLFPAEYAVEAAPRGILIGKTSVAVSNNGPSAVALEASLAPDATDAAQVQVDAYADACTKEAAAVPANCGLRVPWAADLATLTSIAFRIDQRPVLALSPDGRTFAATGGVVVATATGMTRSGADASFTYRADDWALRGTVSFAGDEMVLAVG